MKFEILEGHSERLITDAQTVRHEVFVLGQNVPIERDLDGKDHRPTIQFVGYEEDHHHSGLAICTARVRPIYLEDEANPGLFDAKIERVAVVERLRGNNIGQDLITYIMQAMKRDSNVQNLILESQTHAKLFYERLGFIAVGDEFDDAGIAHIKMEKPNHPVQAS
jgi:predicted GNAT family N-acyltransferase